MRSGSHNPKLAWLTRFLAEDDELMRLMLEANFASVTIGIESPNEESLRETKKFYNVRKSGSTIGKIHTIQNAGLDVWGLMIVGFDHDDVSIFDRHLEFLRDARIRTCVDKHALRNPENPAPRTVAG
ncbi:MAG: hypothetical protein GY801_31400 [bacterium]|nr:hypothetical protein [bacterium]